MRWVYPELSWTSFSYSVNSASLYGGASIVREDIVQGVANQATWWLGERLKKLNLERHDTMEVNPFMAPLISALHGHTSFEDLAEFLIVGHFAIGHATGFGKLVDEKILPSVFNTQKLDRKFRSSNATLKLACFDNIDHIVSRKGKTFLLSQKASKWTIQLGQACPSSEHFAQIGA